MESVATRTLAVVASGLLGLVIGSFLNVVIYRLPRFESIASPPSRCPVCETPLGARENIPVFSWLVLRGRCRHCAAPVSPRYPIVELLTGLVFVSLALASPMAAPLAPLDAVVAVSIAIGAIDLDEAPIPDSLGWYAVGFSSTLVAVSLADHHPGRLVGAAVGAAAAVGAWMLFLLNARKRTPRPGFPGVTVCVAWGWSAGWTGEAGGLLAGIALLVLALVASSGPRFARHLTAFAAAATVVAIVVGTVTAGPGGG